MSDSTVNCQRCGTANEASDLRCPICYLAAPQAADVVGSTRVQIFRCKTCGAAMEYSARAQAPHAGELRTAFDDIVIPATRGLSAVECSSLIPTYALAGGVEQAGLASADAVRERFETSRSVARSRIAEAIERLAEAAGSIGR